MKIIIQGDGEGEHVLHLENILCRPVSVDQGHRAGEQGLQCFCPGLVGAGLRRDGRHDVHPFEHLRRHPPAGGTIDAPLICIVNEYMI